MGRRKISIEPIRHERNRSVTFLKRKNGLFKKAYELGILCSVDVLVVVFGHNQKLYEYSSRAGANSQPILDKRMRFAGEREGKGPADFSDKNGGDDEDEDEVLEDESESNSKHVVAPAATNGISAPMIAHLPSISRESTRSEAAGRSDYGSSTGGRLVPADPSDARVAQRKSSGHQPSSQQELPRSSSSSNYPSMVVPAPGSQTSSQPPSSSLPANGGSFQTPFGAGMNPATTPLALTQSLAHILGSGNPFNMGMQGYGLPPGLPGVGPGGAPLGNHAQQMSNAQPNSLYSMPMFQSLLGQQQPQPAQTKHQPVPQQQQQTPESSASGSDPGSAGSDGLPPNDGNNGNRNQGSDGGTTAGASQSGNWLDFLRDITAANPMPTMSPGLSAALFGQPAAPIPGFPFPNVPPPMNFGQPPPPLNPHLQQQQQAGMNSFGNQMMNQMMMPGMGGQFDLSQSQQGFPIQQQQQQQQPTPMQSQEMLARVSAGHKRKSSVEDVGFMGQGGGEYPGSATPLSKSTGVNGSAAPGGYGYEEMNGPLFAPTVAAGGEDDRERSVKRRMA